MVMPEVGDMLDIFLLRSLLHEGPLTCLFRAEDILTQREVILKIPGCDILNQPILLYHFQNEDRIGRLLDHPGIVRFIHRQRSRQYIIMECIKGKDLRSFLKPQHPMELDRTLAVLHQLCGIVQYMHGQGVCHLDLKPENILCSSSLHIKVIDFGLASCRHFTDLLSTDLQAPLGTPWYIAPEQLQGVRGDPRCDIYTMGMLLYEMLTGQLPWPRTSSLRVARRRLHYDPTPPRHLNSKIPPQIQSIILRAIARLPDERYENVADLHKDLHHWQDLPITPSGRNNRKLPIWKRFWPKSFVLSGKKDVRKPPVSSRKQIIGAFIDDPGCDLMLAELKKQALMRSADITLVHVIEEDDDSHVRRYGIIVEGEKLMCRLEGAVQLLRRCSLDPAIRLIRGEVVDVLQELCAEANVELLVIGGSRKEDSAFCSGSVCTGLSANCSCPVSITSGRQFPQLLELGALNPAELTTEQVISCDIILVDIWYDQLHVIINALYGKLATRSQKTLSSVEQWLLRDFFSSLTGFGQWQEVVTLLRPVFDSFVTLADKIDQCSGTDPADLQKIYLEDVLPLSCRLKATLADVSTVLHSHLVEAPPVVPFLADSDCPVNIPGLSCYGPLLRAFDLGQDLNVLIHRQQFRKSQSERMENN